MEEADEVPIRQFAPPPSSAAAKRPWCTAANIGFLAVTITAVGCWFGDERFATTPTWTLRLNATGPVVAQRIMVPVSRVAPTVLLFSVATLLLARKLGGVAGSNLRRVEMVVSHAVITALLGVLAGCIDFWLLLALFQLGATMAIALILQDFLHLHRLRVEHLAYALALFAWLGAWIVIFDHIARTPVPRTIRGALAVYFVLALLPLLMPPIRACRGHTLDQMEKARDFIGLGSRTVLVIMLTAGLQAVKRGII
jgi:hypothetical protein